MIFQETYDNYLLMCYKKLYTTMTLLEKMKKITILTFIISMISVTLESIIYINIDNPNDDSFIYLSIIFVSLILFSIFIYVIIFAQFENRNRITLFSKMSVVILLLFMSYYLLCLPYLYSQYLDCDNSCEYIAKYIAKCITYGSIIVAFYLTLAYCVCKYCEYRYNNDSDYDNQHQINYISQV